MSNLQAKKIKNLQLEIEDLKGRIEFKCFDCGGQTRRGPGWNCKMVRCPFYKIRPKGVYYARPIPEQFRGAVFSDVDLKPEKNQSE